MKEKGNNSINNALFQNFKGEGIEDSKKSVETEEITMDSNRKSSEEAALKERQEKALNLAENAVSNMIFSNDTEATHDDVFKNVEILMKVARMFRETPILDLQQACSFLSEIFTKEECLLENIEKLSGQQDSYSKRLTDTDKSLWTKVVGYEDSLKEANLFLSNMKEGTCEDLLSKIKNDYSEKDIAQFLSTLKSEIEDLISKSEIKTAYQATAYINLYCKIAILHSFVLWQVFCILNRNVHQHSNTELVFFTVNRSRASTLNLLKCITKPEVKNAVFLSVFDIKENLNVRSFLEIQGHEIHCLDKGFFDKKYEIKWDVPQTSVCLEMKNASFKIWGSTRNSDHFKFESVEEQASANVCYISSTRWPKSVYTYIGITEDGSCEACKKDSSTYKVKWKLISFGKDERDKKIMLASVDFPNRFLYLDSEGKHVRGKRNFEKVKQKGLWKLVEV